MLKNVAVGSFLSLSLLLGASCATTPPIGDIPAAPDWVNNPKKGCGIGQATYRGAGGLTRDTAISAARTDLQRQLQTRITAQLKDYADQEAVGTDEVAEQKVTQARRDLTSGALAGTRVTRTEPKGRELYAEVCFDVDAYKDLIDSNKELSAKAREFLKKRADAEFADLDQQVEKQQ